MSSRVVRLVAVVRSVAIALLMRGTAFVAAAAVAAIAAIPVAVAGRRSGEAMFVVRTTSLLGTAAEPRPGRAVRAVVSEVTTAAASVWLGPRASRGAHRSAGRAHRAELARRKLSVFVAVE